MISPPFAFYGTQVPQSEDGQGAKYDDGHAQNHEDELDHENAEANGAENGQNAQVIYAE